MSTSLNNSAKSLTDAAVRAGMLTPSGSPLVGVASSISAVTPPPSSFGSSFLNAPLKQVPVRDTSSASVNLTDSFRGTLPGSPNSIQQGLERLRSNSSGRSSNSSPSQVPGTLGGLPLSMPTFPASSGSLSNPPSTPNSGIAMPSFPQMTGSQSPPTSPTFFQPPVVPNLGSPSGGQTPVVSPVSLPSGSMSSRLTNRIEALKASASSKASSPAVFPPAALSQSASPMQAPQSAYENNPPINVSRVSASPASIADVTKITSSSPGLNQTSSVSSLPSSVQGSQSALPTRPFVVPNAPSVPSGFAQRIESMKADAASKASAPKLASVPSVAATPTPVAPMAPIVSNSFNPMTSTTSPVVASSPIPASGISGFSQSNESSLAQKIASFKAQSASQTLTPAVATPVAQSNESTLAEKIASFKAQSASQTLTPAVATPVASQRLVSSTPVLQALAGKSASSGSSKLEELRAASSSGNTPIAVKLQQMKDAVATKRATSSVVVDSSTAASLPSQSSGAKLGSASSSPSTRNRASSPTLNLISSLRGSKSSGLGSQRAPLRQEEQFSVPAPIEEATSLSTLPVVTGHEDPLKPHLAVLEKHFLTVDKTYHDRDSGIVYLDVYTKFGTELIIQITLEPGTTVFLSDGHVFQKHEGEELVIPHAVIDAECSKLGTCGMFFKKDAGAVVAHNREGVVHKTGYILSINSEKSIKPDDSVVAIPVIPFEQLELENPLAVEAVFRRAVQDARDYYSVAENNAYGMLNSSHDALGKFNDAYETFMSEYATIIKKINTGLPYIEASIQKYELKTPDAKKFEQLSALRKELFTVKQKLITKAEELSMMVSHAAKAADVITKRLEEGKAFFAKSDLVGGLAM